MAVSRDVARANFARLVKRVLRDARTRGMTDDQIAAETGVGDSTFHRWAKGDWQRAPTLTKVVDFFAGVGEDPEEALIALGIRKPTANPESQPLDPDLKRLARILADPNVPEAEKQAIRHTIRMLSRAARVEPEPAE